MLNKRHTAKRKDNGQFVTGSLMYDFDQDCWRIITYFFDITEPVLPNQFGVNGYEVIPETIQVAL